MNKISIFPLLLLLLHHGLLGQHVIEEGISIDSVELGYSTRHDVRQLYQTQLTDTLTRDCPYTDDCSDFYSELNSIYIRTEGILFQTSNQNKETIEEVLLYPPFLGRTSKGEFQVGTTSIEDIYELYPNSKLTSTNRKAYWILKNKNITFLTKRLEEDGDSPIDSSLILNRTIHLAILYKKRFYSKLDSCETPKFAPKDEEHLNCFTKVHGGWTYYLPLPHDESPWKSVRHGFWKEFYPNHSIRIEGNYDEGERVGEFKFYNEEGYLIETKHYRKKISGSTILKFLLLGLTALWITQRIVKKRKADNSR